MSSVDEFRKDLGEFLKKLINLCYAYDSISTLFRMVSGKSLREAKSIHPAMGDTDILELLNKLLGVSTSGKIEFNGEPGRSLLSVIEMLDDRFSDKHVRELISEVVGVEFPNPSEKYIEVYREYLDMDVRRILDAALKVYSEYNDYVEYKRLLEVLREQGMELSREGLMEKLSTVALLGMVRLEDYGLRIPKKYREVLKNART